MDEIQQFEGYAANKCMAMLIKNLFQHIDYYEPLKEEITDGEIYDLASIALGKDVRIFKFFDVFVENPEEWEYFKENDDVSDDFWDYYSDKLED